VTRGIQKLIKQGFVARFDFLQVYQQKLKVAVGFVESDRCSRWVLQSWMQPTRTNRPIIQTQLEV
jgi:hypothetical protein